ncbi:hypothetical protein [Tenacibaculum sp. IB213877]|uniref:hypothetical protein n=1 Tax=Tenacibaculum sp. IB213877 TaxID=3097351 RepID=UPI002A59F85B|nr:hypothetical protein [Tenacibaculum sp. IB213877]MDY0780911.1 hypothetical protein [Tenacibaculum sp. IB213877]
MSFGGAVSAMITSLKNNKRPRKSVFDKLEKNTGALSGKLYFDKKATQKQLSEIKQRLQKENRIRITRNIIIFLIFISICIYVIGFVKF